MISSIEAKCESSERSLGKESKILATELVQGIFVPSCDLELSSILDLNRLSKSTGDQGVRIGIENQLSEIYRVLVVADFVQLLEVAEVLRVLRYWVKHPSRAAEAGFDAVFQVPRSLPL